MTGSKFHKFSLSLLNMLPPNGAPNPCVIQGSNIYIHIYAYIYIHTHTYIRIHTHTHIYIRIHVTYMSI